MMSEAAHLSLVLLDQRRRWQRHERIMVEAYLEQKPALREDPEALLDLIYNEIVLREQDGDPPQFEEYLQRFPQLGNQLRLQFQVHQAVQAQPLTQIDSVRVNGRSTLQRRPASGPAAGGTSIPGYEILGELGRGGMGVVYAARQVGLNRRVALKMILGGLHADPKVVTRFHTEAEAVARLQHPNIVQIHAIGDQDGLPYFALELVHGTSLEKRLAAGPVPAAQAARLVETLARAMHHAHQHGIIHRDLKPSNILLAGGTDTPIDQTAPKITDFGLAKLLDHEAGQTPAETCVGTPSYMAPEQAVGGLRRVGPAADVYSLGAILYQLLTGRPPFEGTTVLATLEQVRSREPVPPTRLQPQVTRDLEIICLKCLEKEPGQRYGSAQDLAEDLHCFLAGYPIRARPAGVGERAWKWARRRPAAAALLALSVVVVLNLLVAVPWYRRLADQAARRRADEQYQAFLRSYDAALYHGHGIETLSQGTLAPGESLAADRKAASHAARAALASVGVAVDSDAAWVRDPYFSASQNSEITEGCYTLLLVLAEAVAQQPLAGQLPTDRYQEALRILDLAPRLGHPTRAYYLRRAYYLDRLGDPRGAQEARERGAAIQQGSALDHFLLGYEWYNRGELKTAKAALGKALGLQPNHFWARYYLALCHLQARNWEAAEGCLTTCLGQQPGLIWLYLLRGFAHEQAGALEVAEADFQKALELDPAADARYCLYVNRGLLRFQQGRAEEAVVDLKQAIGLEPGQYHAYLSLARVYQKEKKYEESTKQFDQAIQLQPPPVIMAECHAERGRNLYLAGKHEDAVRACADALKIRSDLTVVHSFRGLALLELKRYEQAARSFDQYLEMGGAEVADIYRGRGGARMQLHDYLGARDDYTRALELKPDWEIYTHRGWAYFFTDAWRPARRDFGNAIKLNPTAGDPYVGRGLASVMLGSYRQGVADAEEALRRSPDTPEMMHNVACIFAQAVFQVEKDAAQPESKTLAAHYRERSLEAIRKTLALLPPGERLPFWRDKILPDAALDPIRHCPGFEQIGKDYEARGPHSEPSPK